MRRDDEVATLRMPPHSIEAESSVLGSMLLDYEAINRVPGLTADEFYRPEHKLIFTAIRQLASAGQPCDVVTVFDHLADKA